MGKRWMPLGARYYDVVPHPRIFFEHRGYECHAWRVGEGKSIRWFVHCAREPVIKHKSFRSRQYALEWIRDKVDYVAWHYAQKEGYAGTFGEWLRENPVPDVTCSGKAKKEDE